MSSYLHRRPDPGGIAVTIAIHAGLAAALLLLVDRIARPAPPPPPIIVRQVPVAPPEPQVAPPVTRDIGVDPQVQLPVWDEQLPPPADDGFQRPLLPPDTGPPRDGTLVVPPLLPPPVAGGPSRAPRLIVAAQPAYPTASRRLGEEGAVVIAVSVGADGAVTDVRLVASSGFPRLDAAAIEQARRRWRFEPALRDGQAVAATRTITVTFRLANT